MKKVIIGYLMLMLAASCIAAENIIFKQGAKNWIDKEHYFSYEFSKKPQIGYVIVKIKLYDKTGVRVKDCSFIAVSGMPSMGNAHDSPETAFKLSKKGDYLFPVNIVMLGTWQLNIKIIKENEVIASGVISFDVK